MYYLLVLAELGKDLEKYIADVWPDNIVKLVRASKRLGLIRARLAGADAATGQVLVFLDAIIFNSAANYFFHFI